MKNNIKEITKLKTVLFSIIAIILFFLLLEVISSAIYTVIPFEVISDNTLHHVLKRNQFAFKHKNRFTGKHEKIIVNKQHWHEDRDISFKKSKGTFRIFFVGDSNTYGHQILGNCMTKILEKKLNENLKNRHYEVINTGTTSYSTIIYYLLVKETLLEYSPDLIIINEDMTDVPQDYYYKQAAIFDDNGDPKAVRPDFIGNDYLTPFGGLKKNAADMILSYAQRRSKFILLLTSTVNKIRKMFPAPASKFDLTNEEDQPANWLALNYSPEIKKNIAYSMGLLGKTSKILKKNGIKMVISGVPHYPQFTGKWSARPHLILKETARKCGVGYFDCYSAIKPVIISAPADKYYWKQDPTHFNVEGQRLWAEVYYKYLANCGFLNGE